MGLLNPGGPIAQSQRNRCSILPVEVISLGGVRNRVYHEMLYPYVLQQIQTFARSMKRRKLNSPIKEYANIEELTPEILDDVIERIEVGCSGPAEIAN